jgi:transposase
MSRTAVLTDDDWQRLEPLLPALKGSMGRPMRDHRVLIEGAIYRLRVGCPWRDLPLEFGPWQTVWKRYAKFAKDGTWDRVLNALLIQADAEGRIDWNVSVDSTIARVHQQGATAARSQLTPTSYTGGSIELQGSASS